jgi:hypothetical protein
MRYTLGKDSPWCAKKEEGSFAPGDVLGHVERLNTECLSRSGRAWRLPTKWEICHAPFKPADYCWVNQDGNLRLCSTVSESFTFSSRVSGPYCIWLIRDPENDRWDKREEKVMRVVHKGTLFCNADEPGSFGRMAALDCSHRVSQEEGRSWRIPTVEELIDFGGHQLDEYYWATLRGKSVVFDPKGGGYRDDVSVDFAKCSLVLVRNQEHDHLYAPKGRVSVIVGAPDATTLFGLSLTMN